MSSFNDLNDIVKIKIKKIVVDILQEVSIIDPPVDYNLIYENDKLCKDFVNSKEIKSIDFLKNMQNINLIDFRGLLFIKEKQVLVIDDSGYEKRNNFVLVHEFGHWKIPSHKDLLYKL